MLHDITIEYLLSRGSWIGVGDAWCCEVRDCQEKPTDTLYFSVSEKYRLCSEHTKEYLSRRNRELEKGRNRCTNT